MHRSVNVLNATELYPSSLKMVHFMVRVFYHDKTSHDPVTDIDVLPNWPGGVGRLQATEDG